MNLSDLIGKFNLVNYESDDYSPISLIIKQFDNSDDLGLDIFSRLAKVQELLNLTESEAEFICFAGSKHVKYPLFTTNARTDKEEFEDKVKYLCQKRRLYNLKAA